MQDFFGPDGVLEQRLEDYEYRPSQVRMAEAVHRALEEQSHVIIEAGTGTGKTLAYLLPALLHGRRILVSTGTTTLQDQIFYKDIPLLERVVDRPIQAAYLKGRNNYLCRLKLETLHAEGLFGSRELRNFQSLIGRGRRSVEVRPTHDVARANLRRPEMPGVSCEHAGPQKRPLHS